MARHADDPMVFVGVCPSGLTGFSDDYFRQAHALATEKNARLHVHAARDREEVEFSLAVFGCRPIERLAELGVIDERLVVVHGMLASANEIALLGAGRANLAHSAVEVANILARVPDIAMMRRLGVKVGLGCDNAVNDMFIVMHSAWLMHTVTRGIAGYDPEVMDEADVLAMATSEAAAALGLGDRLGSLEPGKAADLVILDGAAPHLSPVQDLMPELVRAGSRAEVQDRAGRRPRHRRGRRGRVGRCRRAAGGGGGDRARARRAGDAAALHRADRAADALLLSGFTPAPPAGRARTAPRR